MPSLGPILTTTSEALSPNLLLFPPSSLSVLSITSKLTEEAQIQFGDKLLSRQGTDSPISPLTEEFGSILDFFCIRTTQLRAGSPPFQGQYCSYLPDTGSGSTNADSLQRRACDWVPRQG